MSDSKSEKLLALISNLKELDCCTRCILMFIGVESSGALTDSYLCPEDRLKSLENNEEPQTCKRIKKNICSSCLGILEDSIIEQFVLNITLEAVENYESKEFVTLVSLPKCVVLRIYSIYLHIRNKFPEIVQDPFGNKDNLLKRIFRIASSAFITKHINKIYKPKAKLFIEFEIIYEDDENEIDELKKQRRLCNASRTNIEDFIKKCTEEEFRASFPVPPSPPNKIPTCRIKFRSEPIYLGGRYLKFSREMGQTPFIVNNKFITEHSVEDELFKSIKKVLKFNGNIVFSSSGREDSDTRMLGDGRPFYVQIDDPSFCDVSFDQCREIEQEMLSTNLCAVLKLQPVSINELRKIKVGEEHKRKHYRALCHTMHPDTKDVITILNKYKEQVLEIAQITPVRVLHRRTMSSRPKLIYSIQASLVPGFPHLFNLDLITQAGTYVKEFVNSDFNRTTPSVSKLIGYPTDVVALDVMKVELEWP